MAFVWNDEKLLGLDATELENVRRNAAKRGEASLVARIEAIQASKRPARSLVTSSPVVGFHFKCLADYEVTLLPDGRFWSGVWVVDENLCDPAIRLKGYLALHWVKREPSYRQGTIVDWKVETRSKGTTKMGVSFLVEPFEEHLPWFGAGSGEKGYRRLDDTPRWEPKA